MAREFRHRLRVRWGECDAQGVVFFVRYAEYVDIAVTELWRERIRPFGEMAADGTDMVVAEVSLRYHDSARFDDEIDVVLDMQRLGESSLTIAFRIERGADLLCSGTIRYVCIETGTRRTTRIPDEVRAALG